MFNQLIESQPKKQKMAGGTLFSIIFHGSMIGAAVVVTANAGIADDKTKNQKIQFVEMKKEPPKPKEPPPPPPPPKEVFKAPRSEEHTSELQSLAYLVCRLLLEKKKKKKKKKI